MFYISLQLISLKALTSSGQLPRLYLRFANMHYFISHPLIIKEGITTLNISQSFYLPEHQPTFELMLLLQDTQQTKKVLGKLAIDTRQFPLNQQNNKVISLSSNISISLYFTHTFVSKQQLQDERITNSQLDLFQQKQEQIEINQMNTYLQHRNLILRQTLQQLQSENKRLEQYKLSKQRQLNKRQVQRKIQKQSVNRELTQLKQQLQLINIQIGELTNLVNSHGQIDICNTVLSLLSKQA